jgi:hypothetical protein
MRNSLNISSLKKGRTTHEAINGNNRGHRSRRNFGSR